MSIASLWAAAVAGPTSVPAAVSAGDPAPVAAGGAGGLLVVLVWAGLGLVVARALGAFRRRAIVGPERMAGDESAWPLLGLLPGAFGTMVVGSILAASVLSAAGRSLHAPLPADVVQLVAGCAGDAAALVVMLAVLADRRPRLGGLGPAGLSPARLPVALAGGTATLFVLMPLVLLAEAAVEWASRALHAGPVKPHAVLEMMRSDHRPAVAILGIVTAVVVAPAAEETFFRGVMQTLFARAFARLAGTGTPATGGHAMPLGLASAGDVLPYASAPAVAPPHTPAAARWAAVGVTSALFAAVHGRAAFLFPIFVLSVGLGFVYERSGNLYLTMVAHALFNASQVALFLSGAGG